MPAARMSQYESLLFVFCRKSPPEQPREQGGGGASPRLHPSHSESGRCRWRRPSGPARVPVCTLNGHAIATRPNHVRHSATASDQAPLPYPTQHSFPCSALESRRWLQSCGWAAAEQYNARHSWTTVVVLLDERHLGDRDFLLLVPYRDLELRPCFVEASLHIAHPDPLLEAWAE